MSTNQSDELKPCIGHAWRHIKSGKIVPETLHSNIEGFDGLEYEEIEVILTPSESAPLREENNFKEFSEMVIRVKMVEKLLATVEQFEKALEFLAKNQSLQIIFDKEKMEYALLDHDTDLPVAAWTTGKTPLAAIISAMESEGKK